ncbi:hypothetical protein GQ473_00560 [archaeon]|nr:hypothetical protein [archaeon]
MKLNQLPERRPLVFQIDSFKDEVPFRKKIMISKPIAGAFKVTNGKFLCEISLGESSVNVLVRNKKGAVEKFSTAL